jgi:hypothetical protein
VTFYTTWGRVRKGCNHVHTTLPAARTCMKTDHRRCKLQGARSDREIRVIEQEADVLAPDSVSGPGRALSEQEMEELAKCPSTPRRQRRKGRVRAHD